MNPVEVLETVAKFGMVQQVFMIAGGAIVVAGLALYVVVLVLRRDRA